MQTNLRAISPEGRPLNASFNLGKTDAGFELIIESRSGTNRSGAVPRNPDYEDLFELILTRAAALDALLEGVWVVSAKTVHLPEDSRQLLPSGISFPVKLSDTTDFRNLRVRISGMQGGVGRQPGALGPGNRNKRVLLRFLFESQLTELDLVKAMVEGESSATDAALSTILPEGDNSSPAALNLASLEALLKRYDSATPAVRRAAGRRIERGPIGNLLKAAHGYRCQICLALNRETQTFLKPGGLLYVEAHHVDPVAAGSKGSLRAENVIIVCPTHHRELHYGAMANVTDHGDSFEVDVEFGTVTIQKSNLTLILQTASDGLFRPS